MNHSIVENIVDSLALEIGPDASYYRTESERLYLSGIEIATVVATGVFISFCIGFFEGIRKGISKHAEKLGEDLVDSSIDRLKVLLAEINEANQKKQEPYHIAQQTHSKVNNIITSENVLRLDLEKSKEFYPYELQEVAAYLRKVGFPEDEVLERAEVLIVLVQSEWNQENL